jgi:predicted transcriptional regulator
MSDMEFDEYEHRQIKRVDLDIVKRILYSLIHDGPAKKTVIARRSSVSYDNFILYLEFLELLDFIQRDKINGVEIISLNDLGRSFYLRKFSKVKKKSLKKSLRKDLI